MVGRIPSELEREGFMGTVTVRELKVKDVFTITRMLAKVKLPQRTGDETTYGIAILMAALRDASDDLMAWMADMSGMKSAEFAELPAASVLDTIEGIARQEGIKGFFDRLSAILDQAKNLGNDTAGPTSTLTNSAGSDTQSLPPKS
jgi:hypothetical protein